MVRTPLDELVLQMCLLFEHRRGATQSQGVSPIKFLSNAPEPPANSCLENACEHLLEVGALATVSSSVGEDPLYRLTPLGYHLSRLPMDAKVGKVLIVGCILELVDSALTIAAALSCTKSCFLPSWGSNQDRQVAVEKRNRLIGDGFGGRNWKGGTVKGDLIAVIAVHRAWTRQRTGKRRTIFCRDHALDQTAMNEIHSLRSQFRDCLVDGGFLGKEGSYDAHRDDALLTSCCLVAGLYPNIATLMRPRNGGLRGGRLITRDGDICRPSSSSFQTHRVNNALETGKDAYAVFHAKHRSITTEDKRKPQVFLSEVNFVSRYALLLFGGSLQLEKNAIIVDGWLKFKVGDKDQAGCAVLILELRKEVDNIILRHMEAENNERVKEECRELIAVVRKLLTEESSP